MSRDPLPVDRHHNRYRAVWEYLNGVADVGTVPLNLQVARNNLCNFKCVYCTDHRPGNDIPRSQLEGDPWQRIKRDILPLADELSFHGISEFFIDKEFFEIVERAGSMGATLVLNTNGSVCTDRHLDALGNYPGNLVINFSVDAATADTFRRIRGWDFDRVIDNIGRYLTRFAQREIPPWVTFSYVICKSNIEEVVPFIHLAKSFGITKIIFYRLHEYDGLDWQLEAKSGGIFDYQSECVDKFAARFNEVIAEARKTLDELGMHADLPAPVAEPAAVAGG